MRRFVNKATTLDSGVGTGFKVDSVLVQKSKSWLCFCRSVSFYLPSLAESQFSITTLAIMVFALPGPLERS